MVYSVKTIGYAGLMTNPFTPERVFESALRDRTAWWSTAKALRDAAEHIYAQLSGDEIVPSSAFPKGRWVRLTPASGLKNIYVLLVALSIENLLKGDLVRQKPNVVADGKLDRDEFNHDLVGLATSVGLSLSKDESYCLRVAHEACVSWGRYPGGLSHGHGAIAPPEGLDLEGFKRSVDGLFDRLERSVMQGIDDGPLDDAVG
jgi:hypothetical protein